jgi:triosephosphate isomerase
MSSKTILFIANWKMNGSPSNFVEVTKVADFLDKKLKKYKKYIVFCPPISLLGYFSKKNRSKKIAFGAQDISNTKIEFGAETGSLSASLVKLSGAQYLIVGHSERRVTGDNFLVIKEKLLSASKSKLKIIFCIGETLEEKKKNKSLTILKKQILNSLPKKINLNNVTFAYEPVWSIGTGLVPTNQYLEKMFSFLETLLKSQFKIKSPKIIYGGSVNSANIKNLRNIGACSGYLIGGASLKAKNFIEIIKNYYN